MIVPAGLEGFFEELGTGLVGGRSSDEMRDALAGQREITSNRRISGAPCALPWRCSISFGRTDCAAASASASVCHSTKILYSPSLSSPNTTARSQPGWDAISGTSSSARAWASARLPGPNENLTSRAYMVDLPRDHDCA